MAIFEPNLLLSSADREALSLLGQLALASCGDVSNISQEAVALSPNEARRLLELLEQFTASRQFVEGSYFAEGLANGAAWDDDRLREIYLSQRKRRGQSRVASGHKWREFVLRAGFNTSQNAWMWPRDIRRTPLRPMTLDHFLAMEAKLTATAGLHPRVRELVFNFVREAIPKLHEIRERERKVEIGSLKKFVSDFTDDLADHLNGNEKRSMKRRRVVALSTILMDTGAMFATRDWTAAGVLSSLAGIAADCVD